jgi:hypothetical protein
MGFQELDGLSIAGATLPNKREDISCGYSISHITHQPPLDPVLGGY